MEIEISGFKTWIRQLTYSIGFGFEVVPFIAKVYLWLAVCEAGSRRSSRYPRCEHQDKKTHKIRIGVCGSMLLGFPIHGNPMWVTVHADTRVVVKMMVPFWVP